MYPQQYVQQHDPMRIFSYGFFMGLAFAAILFFRYFDTPKAVSVPQHSEPVMPQVAKSLEPQPTPQPKPTPAPTIPTQPATEPKQAPESYQYGPAVPTESDDSRYNAVVTDALFLRETPGLDASKIRQMDKGELVEVIVKTREPDIIRPHHADPYPVQAHWYQVRTQRDNQIGWIFGTALGRRN